MSFLVCPLCGKSTLLRSFANVELEGDILVQMFRGLGRGRGFEVASRESILTENETTRIIADRAMDILLLLMEHDILDSETVISRLDVTPEDDGDDEFDDDETLHDAVDVIEAVLPEDIEWDTTVDDDDPGDVLRERVQYLVTEYVALEALREDERRRG